MTVIGPGDHVIDIGAHVGYMTLLAASRVTAAGSVLAIEANSDNFALLRANVERNTLTNVRPVEGAAWRQSDEELTMTVSPDNSGDHRVFQRDGAANTVQVRSVAVDDLITDDWRADVVKVDVQGTDHVAIEGMRRTIERFRPTLLVEFWPKGIEEFGGQADQVLAFYRELGYDLTILEVPTLSRDAALSRVVDAAWRCPWGYCTLLLQPHEKPE
jgi:FkbM family methyltransferase